MSNKIQAYLNYKKIDRGRETLPKSWRWPSSNTYELSNPESRKNQIRQWLSQAQAVVCILTEYIEDTSIISYLHELTQEGRRVYLLLGKYSPKLDKLRGHCLIRILPASILPMGSLILSDPSSHSSKCLLLSGTLGEQRQIELLYSSDKQETIIMLFRYFCHLFWEQANTEYLCENDTTGRAIVDKGVDVYFDPEKLHPHYLYDKLLINSEGLSRWELVGKYISLASGMQHLYIEASGERTLDDITFSHLPTKEEFEQIYPDSFPDELGYLETSYQWRVLPYYLPKDAERSSYYKDWEKYSIATTNTLNRLINEIDCKQSNILLNKGANYARLYNNFKFIIKNIREELSTLKDFRWGYDPTTDTKQQKLKTLKAEYQTTCKKFDYDVKCLVLEQKLAQNKEKIEWLRKSLDALLEKMEFDKQKSEKSEEYQREIKEIKKEIERSENEGLRIKREHRETKDQTNTSNNESSLEQLYKKGINKGDENIQTDISNFTLPILPRVGYLFQFKQKLFLAINNWDEYDAGLREAERLGAELCANNNSSK